MSACQSSSAHVATVPSQIFLRVIKPGCAYGRKGKLCPSYARTASSRGEVSPCSAAFSLTRAQAAGNASLRAAWWGLYCASASAYRLVMILSCNLQYIDWAQVLNTNKKRGGRRQFWSILARSPNLRAWRSPTGDRRLLSRSRRGGENHMYSPRIL